MPRCKDCKLVEDLRGKVGRCYGFKIPDIRLDVQCKFFEEK